MDRIGSPVRLYAPHGGDRVPGKARPLERIDDEPFWRAQERRRERELGQPCCTQSGISWQLMDMPGRFAVVVHGEYDCVNCFRHNAGRSSVQYFSTRLSEGQLTSGETAEPLRRCLELIVEHERPDAVVVLGTCPVEVIGDQFDRVVEAVSGDTGVPMVALHTSGLKLSTQQDMLDWCFDTLVGLGDNIGDPALRDAVALVGMPVSRLGATEIEALMTRTSLELLASFPNGATLSDWARLPHCRNIVVSDRGMFPRLLGRLARAGCTITESPLPFGLAQTTRVHRDLLGLDDDQGGDPLAEQRARASARIAAFRARWEGTPMALTIRMHNSTQFDMVARGGLGHVGLFTELGLDVTLLIQGSPDPSMRSVWSGLLRDHGLDLAFDVFPGPYAVGECIGRGQYRLVCVADWVHQEVARTGVPTVFSHQMRPWLNGVESNLGVIERALEASQ